MKTFHIKIGEHLIEILSSSYHLIQKFHKNFQLISVHQDVIPNLYMHIEEGYGVPFVDYDVKIINETNKILFRRADYLIEVDYEYHNAKILIHNELALKHALMTLYSSFIVHHGWGLLIHSSCVIDNERAHIFAGHSGSGKSTSAKLSYPRTLLSDEATLVKITSDEITVFNSPFRSELETTDYDKHRSLASIQILFQDRQNKRIRLRKSDALLSIMNKVFYWTHLPEETGKILVLLTTLIQTVNVYDLYFQKNIKFWELIS